MVAKITFPKRIEAALNYNEQKVKKGIAFCLHAENYLTEACNLNFYQKLNGFQRQNDLNDRATTKTLHVSLNFAESEKLSEKKLIEVASLYMNKIGFGKQPFLVYKHEDAGHPHIHIVSTTIRKDGSRINTHNIRRNQSEKARKEIEQSFGLVKAEKQENSITQKIKPVSMEKVNYGKQETKQSISNIVAAVFSQYRFSSLPEFNAALKQFNVVADRGKEEGRIYKNGGLVYRVLNENENKVGVPIKASCIWCKPILKNLETKYELNKNLKEALKLKTKIVLDVCLKNNPGSMQQFKADLEQKQIHTVLRQNPAGRIYGITFVDNHNKCVFNGSDLGKGYCAAFLEIQFTSSSLGIDNNSKLNTTSVSDKKQNGSGIDKSFHSDNPTLKPKSNPLEILFDPEYQYLHNDVLSLLKKKKRKRKNRKPNLKSIKE